MKFYKGRISTLTPDHFTWKKYQQNCFQWLYLLYRFCCILVWFTSWNIKPCPFCQSHTGLKVAARSPYPKIIVLKILSPASLFVRADFYSVKCRVLIRSQVKMTLQGPLVASVAPALEITLRLRCWSSLRQQGMLLIGIKGTGRMGWKREFHPVLPRHIGRSYTTALYANSI